MTRSASVHRRARLPDETRIARYRRAPEIGPRILFFSGGSALRQASRSLKQYTHNSIHLITPFDSGGSSAQLRRAFDMLSVGDLRNRMLALADESLGADRELYTLCSHRFSEQSQAHELRSQLDEMLQGIHPLVAALPGPMRQLVRSHLLSFAEQMPKDFDLRGASIGNLILAGGYLANQRDIDSAVYLFSKLVDTRGVVRPICDANLHLCAELEDGTRRVGQHRLTAKGDSAIESPVRALSLVDGLEAGQAVEASAGGEIRALVRDAELICYPIGSFYSSLLSNLLPLGIGRSIAEAGCPKVFVPNMGVDPEQLGMTLSRATTRLIDTVRSDAGEHVHLRDIVDFVLIDSERGDYRYPLELESIKQLGIEVLDLELVSANSDPLVDPDRLTQILLSLV